METRAAWSAYDAGGRPRHRHLRLAGRADPAPADVRARARPAEGQAAAGHRRMSAAASGRSIRSIAESTLIAWATRKLGRGLRWSCRSRRARAVRQPCARSRRHRPSWRSMPTADSSAVRVKAEANFGAYVSMFAPTIPTTGLAKVISGLYRIPAIRIDFDCAFTNTVPVDAIRGAGKPEALFLLERLVDIAAHETGRTPADLRRLNLLQPADMPYAAASGYTYDAADCPRLFETALTAADEPGFAARRAASEAARQAARPRPRLPSARHRRHRRRACRRRGRRPTGWSRGSARRARARATRRCSPRSSPQALGVPVERIEVRQGDTRTIPHGGGTGGSSSTIISGTTLEARRRRGDPARPRPRRRAARDGAGRHRLSRRRVRDRRHRPPHRPVRAGGVEAVRGRRRVRRQDRDPSRPASWSARSRSIPRPARSRSTA